MKKLVYIFFWSTANAQVTDIHINEGTTSLAINTGSSSVNVNYGFGYYRLAMDDGYYNGFPMIADVYNGESTAGVYKKSFTHGGAGYLMLTKTTNGGRYWSEDSIRVDGSVISSTNHSFYRYDFGRLIISYKLNGDTSLRFAWNDDDDVNFTSSATIVTPAANYAFAQCPNKMVLTSYGSLLFTYYKVGSAGNSAIIMESLDSGKTFSEKCVIYSSNDTYPTNFPACRGNEFALVETHPTGIEATSKWMAIVRPEVASDGGGYYMIYRSTDGANSWSQDLTTIPGSFVDDNGTTVTGSFSKSGLYLFLSSNSPVSARKIGDSVYVVNGVRNVTHGYALMYLSASADSAFSNGITSWTRHAPVKYYYNGANAGSSFDYGYPTLFKNGTIPYVTEYTVSDLAPLPGVTRRCLIETIKLK